MAGLPPSIINGKNCKYCGAAASVARVVQFAPGEYEYLCEPCAMMDAPASG